MAIPVVARPVEYKPAAETQALVVRRSSRAPAARPPRGDRAIAPARGGARCPLCGKRTAAVEVRFGPVYAKLCSKCIGSASHLIGILSRLMK
jgi:hypothetical protein